MIAVNYLAADHQRLKAVTLMLAMANAERSVNMQKLDCCRGSTHLSSFLRFEKVSIMSMHYVHMLFTQKFAWDHL